MNAEIQSCVEGVVRSEAKSIAHAMRWIDDRQAGTWSLLAALYEQRRAARVVGVTGPAGVGKSTLVDGLIAAVRAQGARVGVIAVDPSSESSGGAFLGDRVRMQRHTQDGGVFMRSVATRGAVGGLSTSVDGIIRVLDAAGFDWIFVETVGVGQDELDVSRVAEMTLVVLAPGFGDEVQSMKAGILEVADVYVVNKSDEPGADRLVRDLRSMMELGGAHASLSKDGQTCVVETVAKEGKGVEELLTQANDYLQWLRSSAGQAERLNRQKEYLKHWMLVALVEAFASRINPRVEEHAATMVAESKNPYLALTELALAELQTEFT